MLLRWFQVHRQSQHQVLPTPVRSYIHNVWRTNGSLLQNIHPADPFQILILELAIDGLRLAALNTPSMLSTPLSVIAGIVMGEFSVESGWFNSEIMLYMAFVSIANYTQPNFELGYALKFMRLLLLILTAILNPIRP